MDNRKIDITAEGNGDFRIAFSLFDHHDKVVGYRIEGMKLVLYWTESPKMTAFPYSYNQTQAVDFVLGWLASLDYGAQPDHDGDNGKGWQMYNESWGHIDSEWQAFCAVKPAWAMYGK